MIFQVIRIRTLEENVAVQENTIAHLNEKLREARREAETWKDRLNKKVEQSKQEREKFDLNQFDFDDFSTIRSLFLFKFKFKRKIRKNYRAFEQRN